MFKRNLFIFAIMLTVHANQLVATTVTQYEDTEQEEAPQAVPLLFSDAFLQVMAEAPSGSGQTGAASALASILGLSSPSAASVELPSNIILQSAPTLDLIHHLEALPAGWENYTWIWDGQSITQAPE